jgi:hypothetical protein
MHLQKATSFQLEHSEAHAPRLYFTNGYRQLMQSIKCLKFQLGQGCVQPKSKKSLKLVDAAPQRHYLQRLVRVTGVDYCNTNLTGMWYLRKQVQCLGLYIIVIAPHLPHFVQLL